MATSSPWLIFSDHYPEILIAITCFIIFSFLRSARCSNKESLPYKWPIFGMLPEIVYSKAFNELVTARLRETGWTFVFKGPLIVNMDRIVTCDPANMNHMFNLNFDNYPKGDLYKVFDVFGDNLFNADGDNWYNHRIMAQTVFWDGNYRAMQAKLALDKVENALIPILDSAACKKKPLDLQDVFLRFTFDISCQCVLDSDPGTLSLEFPTVPFAKACDEALDATLTRHITPPHIWKLKRFLNIGSEKIRATQWKVLDAYIFERIAKIKEKIKHTGKNTSYNAMALYVDNCNLINDQRLRDTAYTFLLVQRNTLALTMAWLFYALFLNPRVLPKILDELQSILDKSSDKRFKDGNALFDGNMIQSAIYLHATFCEVLRYYPPVPFEIKDALNADVLPSGHKVKAGDKILFSPYAMARMKVIWGDDCMEFKPERWITENGTLKHEPAYKFFAFSAGPRICLGKELAFNEMKIVVANIIYNFDVQMVKGHVVEQRTAILMEMKQGLMVEVSKRSSVK